MGSRVAGRESGDPSFLRGAPGFFPWLLLRAIWWLLLGRPRSLAADARLIAQRLDPPPRVEGARHIPPRGPFVLVGNHFQAPNVWIGWVAAAISSVVAEARAEGGKDLHWLALSEWRWLQIGERWVPNPLSALLFPRAARVWGLVPTPSNPADVAGRARALRAALAYLGLRGRGRAAEPVALFPEGTATVALAEALPGSGAFLYSLSRRGVPLVPVGVFAEDDNLVLRFGEPFALASAPPGAREDVDAWARRRVMTAIGRLLPRHLWGAYADAIAGGD